MKVTRTFDLLNKYAEEFADKQDALVAKINGTWVKHSAAEYIENANNISYGFFIIFLIYNFIQLKLLRKTMDSHHNASQSSYKQNLANFYTHIKKK